MSVYEILIDKFNFPICVFLIISFSRRILNNFSSLLTKASWDIINSHIPCVVPFLDDLIIILNSLRRLFKQKEIGFLELY